MRDSKKLSDQVYEALRHDILATRIRPGEKLSEAQLAARYGVSRAPVRDAFARLEEDNLVEVRPQVGTIVSPISEQSIVNILEVRMLLEPAAARRAAGNLTDDDREALKRQFERLAQHPQGSATKKRELFETDSFLHALIWERCGNPEIKRILDRYRGAIQRIRMSNADYGNRLAPSEHEIREIFSALHAGDGVGSAKALTRHLENISKALRAVFTAIRNAPVQGRAVPGR